MIRFYAPDIEETGMLPETESGHCCRVLRMKAGDRIYVVDGKGNSYECEICDPHPKKTQIKILSKTEEKPHWKGRIVMGIAPTKNLDRMEWFVEKAVEIGVDEIVFLKCEHSERKEIKLERLHKIAVSAMKQSMKAMLPELRGMVPVGEFVEECPCESKYMGYCDKNYPVRKFAEEYEAGRDVAILIGPEGDFSPEEVGESVRAGFIPVTFGNTRLRTETAALYSLCAVHVLNNE